MKSIDMQIQSIIDMRRSRVQEIESCMARLSTVQKSLKDIGAAIAGSVTADGKIIPGGPFEPVLNSTPGLAAQLAALDLDPCTRMVEKAGERLADYHRRASRQYVNIGVVGPARGGKSLALQSATGLNGMVIPSSDADDCTGAASVITNVPGHPLEATLTFKTRQEMVKLAQDYLDAMITDPEKRIVLTTMEDIASLDLSKGGDVASRCSPGASGGVYMKYLHRLVDHFGQWASCAGRTEPLVLRDEGEIAAYVAQHNGLPMGHPGRKDYYRYLAVKSCHIVCSFPEKELGSIRLIDTIGIGDNALDITQTMLRTIRDECDAVMLLTKPSDSTGGGLNASFKELYDSIYQCCRDRSLDDWLFHLVNHVSEPVKNDKGEITLAVNTPHAMAACRTIRESNWFGHEPKLVNVSRQEEMQSFLLGMLETLATRLDKVDDVFRREAEAALEEARVAVTALSEAVNRMIRASVTGSVQTNQLLLRLINDKCRDDHEKLHRLGYAWKQKRNYACVSVRGAADSILHGMMQGAYLPPVEEIEAALGRDQMITVFTRYMNSIRNRVKDEFQTINTQLENEVNVMKAEVARVLRDDMQLGRLTPAGAQMEAVAWMRNFARDKVVHYDCLHRAMETISGFEFSVKGFLSSDVREALTALDPDLRVNIPAVQGASSHHVAINIYDELDRMLVTAARQLRRSMEHLSIQPSRALSAEVEDFVDRMLYAQDAHIQWQQFYMGEAAVLWAKEIAHNQQSEGSYSRWHELLSEVKDCAAPSLYTLTP